MVHPGISGLSLRTERLKLSWLLAVPFILFANPSAGHLVTGGGISLGGLLLRGWAAGSIRKDRTLAVTGPYSRLRHPLYLGSFLLGLGLATAGGRWVFPPAFIGLFAWAYGRAIRAEELELALRFGDDYERYRTQVPRFFPRLRPYFPGDGGPRGLGRRSGPAFRWDLFHRNKEWQATVGAAVGFGLLCAKAALVG